MFSGAVKLLDLNDFIAPAQDCVVIKKGNEPTKFPQTFVEGNEVKSEYQDALKKLPDSEISKAIKVSLHDCLACSGCVTSAETVLLQQQSEQEFLLKLQSDDALVAVTISPQSRSALAEYFGLSPRSLAVRLSAWLRGLGVRRVYDLATARDLALLETAEDFICRFKLQRSDWQDTAHGSIVTAAPAAEAANGPVVKKGSRVFGRGRGNTFQRDGSKTSEEIVAGEKFDTSGGGSALSTSLDKRGVGIGADAQDSALKVEDAASREAMAGETEAPRPLPVLASSCPGWVVYAEKSQNSRQLLPHLCTARSPQAVQGALVKRLAAAALGVAPRHIYHVTVMPCYDKKLEAARDDLTAPADLTDDSGGASCPGSTTSGQCCRSDDSSHLEEEPGKSDTRPAQASPSVKANFVKSEANAEKVPETDCCLTTGELLGILHSQGVDLAAGEDPIGVSAAAFDSILDGLAAGPQHLHNKLVRGECDTMTTCCQASGEGNGDCLAASRGVELFGLPGGSGGYAEYVFRRAARELYGRHVGLVEFKALRNNDFQEAILLPEEENSSASAGGGPLLRVARVYGFRNIQTVLRQIRTGKSSYHFIEIMACPGGCLNGGGQIKASEYGKRQNLGPLGNPLATPDSRSTEATTMNVDEEREMVGRGKTSGTPAAPSAESGVLRVESGLVEPASGDLISGFGPVIGPDLARTSRKELTPQELLERLEAKYHHQDVTLRLPEDNPEVRALYWGAADAPPGTGQLGGAPGSEALRKLLRARFTSRDKAPTSVSSLTSW